MIELAKSVEGVASDNLARKRQQLVELMLQQKQKASASAAPTIPRRHQSELPVLSFNQRRLWFIEQLQPGSSAYHVAGAVRIHGPLDTEVLARCVREIARRHETLRTRIASANGEPLVEVSAEPTLCLAAADLSGTPVAMRETEARRLVGQMFQEPFDLAAGPLARTLVLRLSESEHIFLLVYHHLISDAWSIGVFFRNMTALYDAFSQGLPSPLPELSIQYSDYAVWQQRLLEGEGLERLLSFWRDQLAGAPLVLDLATDRPRPPLQTFRGGQSFLTVDPEVADALRATSQQQEVSLFMALLATFQTLLFRYTGQQTILIGIPVANRNRVELEGIIGLLVNTLVLRVDLSAAVSFRSVLGQVRERVLAAFAHQDLPFEKLVEELRIERDTSRNPIYQVLFTYQNVPASALDARGLSLNRYEVQEEVSRQDLELNLRESGGGLAGWLAYNAGLFEPTTAARLTTHLVHLLRSAAEEPERQLAELPLLSPAETLQILTEWNDTATDEEPPFVTEMVWAHAERAPDAVAAVCGGTALTYGELAGRAAGLAAHLTHLGAGPNSLTALLIRRGCDLLSSILGVLTAGGAYLPLDAEHPAKRLAQVLARSGAPLLLASADLHETAASAVAELRTPPRILALPDLLEGSAGAALPSWPASPEDLAYVLFTSGSTGIPKGAMVTRRGMLNHLQAKIEDLGLTAGDAVAQTASQCFDISVWQHLAALLVGGRIHIYPDEVSHDPARLLAAVESDGVSVLEAVPSQLRMLLDEVDVAGAERPRPVSLRWMIPTGEALPVDVTARWFAAFPHVPLLNAYGPTECADRVTHHRIDAPLSVMVPRVPIGRALRRTRLYVVDRAFHPAPLGVPGELWIGGAGVARGYLNDPERTAAAFVPDPFGSAAGERLYRTGDLVRRLADGTLDFFGRIDHQVKIRGFRIELGEIETVLARHPAVRQAAVLAQEAGPAGRVLVAYLVAEAVNEQDLRDVLQERLPEYMVPAAFVILDALPLNANGKLDRRALASLGGAVFAPRQEYVAPRTPVEEALAGIWAGVLRVPRVGLHDNFFELGGQSLLATQVISRIREAFAVEIPVRALFQHPQVGRLAEIVEAALLRGQGMPEVPPMVRVPRDADLPLSFAQERLWFIDRLRPGLTAYNIFGAVRMRGRLAVPVLERSFSELVRRHEVLRTTFTEDEGRPVQVIHPPADLPIPVVDLRAAPESQRPALGRLLVNEEAQRSFDLSRGPLIRGVLLRLDDEDHLLAVTAHHIVYDVWSREILVRELGTLYEAFWHGHPSPLPELAIQYADFAQWQRAWLQGEVLDTQLAYWIRQLAGTGSGSELPGDRPRPPVQSFHGSRVLFRFSEEDSAAVRDLARRQGATVFMTLLAGFDALLARITGEDQITVGSPIANRNRAEIEAMIGFFVNTQVLRTPVAGDPTFRELLARIREVTLGAYANQDLAFEHLVKALKPQRDPSRQPLFQILFNFLTNYRPIHMELPEVTLTPEVNHSGAAQFDLVVSFYDANGFLHCSVDYAVDIFDRPTPLRLLHQLTTLLASAAADPERPLTELAWMTVPELHQVACEWNDTAADLPGRLCLHELVEAQVDRAPAATAVVFEGTALTYAELEVASNRLARRLLARGVRPCQVVGVHAERSLEMVVALLAVLKAGAAYLPLDPSYPDDRLAYMLSDSGLAVVMTHGPTAGRLAGRLPSGMDEVRLDATFTDLAGESAERLPRQGGPGFPAYVIYTSGSTGLPKGAAVHHAAICNRLLWMQAAYGLAPGERVLQKTPFSFDVSVWEFFWPLLAGACLVVARPGGHQDPSYLARLIAEWEVTTLHFVPSMLRLFLEAPDLGALPSLQRVIASGEALPREVAQSFLARFPAELHNLYGPTEAAVDVTAWACAPGDERVPIGRPIANLRTHVLDRSLRPLSIGAPGELFLGGAGLGLGYVGRPDLTADRFLPSPLGIDPGERLYRTGDLVRLLPDGSLDYLGRTDHQVKVRGFRIELGEIEAVLAGLPGVRAGAVVVRQDGAGNRYLAGHVVPEEGGCDVDALRRALHARLPDYMVPSAITLMETLPLSPNGKVNRRALTALEGAPLPVSSAAFVAPSTEVEKRLVGIWAELLGIDPERIGTRDNFFYLGGHSLLTTQLLYRMREAFEVEIELATFFDAPTMAGLAEAIEVDRWMVQATTEPALTATEGEVEEWEL